MEESFAVSRCFA